MLGDGAEKDVDLETLRLKLAIPNAERIFYIAQAFEKGASIDEVYELTKIDRWFLRNIAEVVAETGCLKTKTFLRAKKFGFSDRQLAVARSASEKRIRSKRKAEGVVPTYRLVDTCAAEFEAYTPYYYSTYGDENERRESDKRKIMILGGGPNRIGQGIEFDYCCVHAAFALKEDGFETIMVNSNPETVSTDYDTSDKLFFEPLTLEDVLHIYERENWGAIAQFGGQTPLNLALACKKRRQHHRHVARKHRDRRRPQTLRGDAGQAEHSARPPNGSATSDAEAGRRDREEAWLSGSRSSELRARRARDADRLFRHETQTLHAFRG